MHIARTILSQTHEEEHNFIYQCTVIEMIQRSNIRKNNDEMTTPFFDGSGRKRRYKEKKQRKKMILVMKKEQT